MENHSLRMKHQEEKLDLIIVRQAKPSIEELFLEVVLGFREKPRRKGAFWFQKGHKEDPGIEELLAEMVGGLGNIPRRKQQFHHCRQKDKVHQPTDSKLQR